VEWGVRGSDLQICSKTDEKLAGAVKGRGVERRGRSNLSCYIGRET